MESWLPNPATWQDFVETFILAPKRLEGKRLQQQPAMRKTRPKPLILAYAMRELLETGAVNTRAEIARKYGFSRARVTQILNLLKLPVQIHQRILRMPEEEQRYFTEHRLRTLTRHRCREEILPAFERMVQAAASESGRENTLAATP